MFAGGLNGRFIYPLLFILIIFNALFIYHFIVAILENLVLNNLIKILTKIPIYIVAVVLCIAIRLISPWIIIRIAIAPSGNYGVFVRDLAFYCCKKKLKIRTTKTRSHTAEYTLK